MGRALSPLSPVFQRHRRSDWTSNDPVLMVSPHHRDPVGCRPLWHGGLDFLFPGNKKSDFFLPAAQ
jgi:hypothetical protein